MRTQPCTASTRSRLSADKCGVPLTVILLQHEMRSSVNSVSCAVLTSAYTSRVGLTLEHDIVYMATMQAAYYCTHLNTHAGVS
jgi:hypothetical protein